MAGLIVLATSGRPKQLKPTKPRCPTKWIRPVEHAGSASLVGLSRKHSKINRTALSNQKHRWLACQHANSKPKQLKPTKPHCPTKWIRPVEHAGSASVIGLSQKHSKINRTALSNTHSVDWPANTPTQTQTTQTDQNRT